MKKSVFTILALVVFAVALIGQQPQPVKGSKVSDIDVYNIVSSKGTLFWDQLDYIEYGWSSQDLGAGYEEYNSEAADDFVVTDGPMEILSISFVGTYSTGGGPLEYINIRFYEDNSGIPGDLISEFLSVPCDTELKSGLATADLPSEVILNNGTYWISIVAVMDFDIGKQWFFNESTTSNGALWHWRNPGDGFGTGQTDWGPGEDAFSAQGHDLAFALHGVGDETFPEPGALTFSTVELGIQIIYPVDNEYFLGDVNYGDLFHYVYIEIIDDNMDLSATFPVYFEETQMGVMVWHPVELIWAWDPQTDEFNWKAGLNTLTTTFINEFGNELELWAHFNYIFHKNVTFNLDISDLDFFDSAEHELYLSGGHATDEDRGIGNYERWARPGDNSDFIMTDAGEGVYTITLENVPTADYEYKYFWIEKGSPSWDNGYPVHNMAFSLMDGDVIIGDKWVLISSYSVAFSVYGGNGTISASVNGETISSGDLVEKGAEIVFTASPATGYKVKQWKVGGDVQSETGDVFTYVDLQEDIAVTVEFEQTVVVAETGLQNVRLYPNPFRNEIIVSEAINVNRIAVTNVVGVKLIDLVVSGDTTIGTSDMPAGIYFIIIESENGERVVRKLVKQ